MKTISTKPRSEANCVIGGGFTLTELLVVITVIALLAALRVAALAGAKDRTKVAQCASNVRQIALATQIYAGENKDRLPVATAGAWAWDISGLAAKGLLSSGLQKRNFYCPGTAPRFDDKLNYLNSYPNSLWEFGGGTANDFHVAGYVMAFNSSTLILSNQNTTILPESPKLSASVSLSTPSSKDRVLVADATISEWLTGTAANPAPAGSFTVVFGGFAPFGTALPHISPHLKGTLPAGGNVGFKDGHVQWRSFRDMTQRAIGSSRGFWW